MGRPVQFIEGDADADANAQSDLEGAARAAGFKTIEFQYEPIAAALEYEAGVRAEETVLIVDIGGGTSDFSIVRVSPARAKQPDRAGDILANRGIRVGGTDFDRMTSLRHVMPLLGLGSAYSAKALEVPKSVYFDLSTWSRVNWAYEHKSISEARLIRREAARPDLLDRLVTVLEQRLGHRVIGEVEQAKIALSSATATEMAFDYVEQGLHVSLARAQLGKAIGPGLVRIEECMKQTMADAGLGPDRIDTIFLTGGSSMAPAVQALVGRVVSRVQDCRRRHVRLGRQGPRARCQAAVPLNSAPSAALPVAVVLGQCRRRVDKRCSKGSTWRAWSSSSSRTTCGPAGVLELPADRINRIVYVVHGTIDIGGNTFEDDSAWHGRGAAQIRAGKAGAALWRWELVPAGTAFAGVDPACGGSCEKALGPIGMADRGRDSNARGQRIFPAGRLRVPPHPPGPGHPLRDRRRDPDRHRRAFDELRTGRAVVRGGTDPGVRTRCARPADPLHPRHDPAGTAEGPKLDQLRQRRG